MIKGNTMGYFDRRQYKKGYRAGVKDEHARAKVQMLEQDREIFRIRTEKNNAIGKLKLEMQEEIKSLEKTVKKLKRQNELSKDRLVSDLKDREVGAFDSLGMAESQLKNFEALEFWVTQNFHKAMQAGVMFADGLSQRISKFKDDQAKARKKLPSEIEARIPGSYETKTVPIQGKQISMKKVSRATTN